LGLTRLAGDQREKSGCQPEFLKCAQADFVHRGVNFMSTCWHGKIVREI
jgi:hypothetical protein